MWKFSIAKTYLVWLWPIKTVPHLEDNSLAVKPSNKMIKKISHNIFYY